jgi:hypothetical protein
MGRIQFIEIHEQTWFPSSIRDEITDALQFGFKLLRVYSPIAPRLQCALDSARGKKIGAQEIVDMCSGGGGPWFDLALKLQSQALHEEKRDLQVWLTDKYPNRGAHKNLISTFDHRITSYPRSVDAVNVPAELQGFRTMFTAFHHFQEDDARNILQSAVDAGEGIGIFEITRRAPAAVGLVLAWVLLLFVCTPWISPFRWSRLLWTFLVPIIPSVLLFDGIVSCLRTYRPCELKYLVDKLSFNNYRWDVGEQRCGLGRPRITYLIGHPPALRSN